MGVKKLVKKLTGADRKERRAEEDMKRQAEVQAQLDANASKLQADAAAGAEVAETVDTTQKASTAKKKVKGGRKGLTVARSSGAGINV